MIELQPVEHKEAIGLLRGKPAVLRNTFERMTPGMMARAFTISHVESLKTIAEVRDRIADLPAGESWEKVRKDVAKQLSPHLVTSEDPEEREQQLSAAYRRSELLLRTHGYQAYEAANYRAMQETKAAFPYWQYQTMEDGKVRPEHAALNGIVLPADSPFWDDHYPPWDWGCRCTVIALSPEDVEELRKEDAERNPEDRLVVDGVRRTRLERDAELTRGPIDLIDPNDPDRKRVTGKLSGGTFDMRAPAAKGQSRNAFQWKPGELTLRASELAQRYGAESWRQSARALQGALMVGQDGRRTPLWDWVLEQDRAAAIDELRAHNRRTKQEMAIAMDYDTGIRIGDARGDGTSVVTRDLIESSRKAGLRVALMHNHPNGTMISPQDVAMLARHADVVQEIGSVGGWYQHRVSLDARMAAKPMPRLAKRMEDMQRQMADGDVSEREWRNELKRLGQVHGIQFVEDLVP